MLILTTTLVIITGVFLAVLLLLFPTITVAMFFDLKYCDELITAMQASLILMLYFGVLTMISCALTTQCMV